MSKNQLSYTSPTIELNGVGEAVAKKLQKLGLETVGDIVENIPRSFDDYSKITPISRVKPGKITLQATISNIKIRYTRNGIHLTEGVARDGTGQLHLTWFNQPYLSKSIKKDEEYFISGDFATGTSRYISMVNPRIELVSAFPKHTARLLPNYRLTSGLSAYTLRKIIAKAIESTTIQEVLPSWIVKSAELMDRRTAIQQIHFPDDLELFAKAKKRLAFEELFVIMMASELNKQMFASQSSYPQEIHDNVLKNFTDSLPYTLTDDQRKAAWRMLQLMQDNTPMNCLLQGDVGSGKTVVALLVALNVIADGGQVAFMAPTELLATQQYKTCQDLLPDSIASQTVLLTGSLKPKDKKEIQQKIKDGEAKLIIGTHALIQEKAEYESLQLVIVDEQHRFGVEQRKALQSKAEKMPHVLHMSATPIPRSIALTLYGELDVVTIMSKPQQRHPVKTRIIAHDHRKEFYQKQLHEIVNRGEQCFIVAPLIEDSESNDKKNVEKLAKEISRYTPDARIAVLHGKLPSEQKDEIMQRVKNGKIDILIATTVIEVGIDIPNATLMVIESADTFGLAQLHQLRGRVGRGDKPAECVLIPSKNTTSKRLNVLASENNGFRLAEYDLELRGPGALYGTIQHGALDLRIAKISDTELIAKTRSYAQEMINKHDDLEKYLTLHTRVEAIRSITNLN